MPVVATDYVRCIALQRTFQNHTAAIGKLERNVTMPSLLTYVAARRPQILNGL